MAYYIWVMKAITFLGMVGGIVKRILRLDLTELLLTLPGLREIDSLLEWD